MLFKSGEVVEVIREERRKRQQEKVGSPKQEERSQAQLIECRLLLISRFLLIFTKLQPEVEFNF